MSDNGPQFVSAEFEKFMKENGVKHFRSAPYHPSTNGLAERFVQSLKQALKVGERQGIPKAVFGRVSANRPSDTSFNHK